MLCPGTDAAGGAALARRLRETVAATPVITDRASIDVTISIGVSARVFENLSEVDQIISEADGALYSAKHGGRNRVEVAVAAAPA